ncbi:putative retrotransposon hot spot protein (RHS) [Trypanosoma cruzi]|uniref:Putative retrotransposon hot spot protein (RHS) n=1 Tax=Trypanosoma cruzi TaxID=5693 RepID=A0A2V2WLV2_TRYCR|nr:putative retrotransposon hot spot protein (RHS) [Trypanosoma cruzi]RNC57301.1 retrotransposon hot spot (RHS) protein [Trypanosoma cruzi]
MWRCCGRLHVALLRGRWALTVSPTGVAVRLHGAPTVPPCECHAQRHWDCGRKQLRVSFGASGIFWPQLGGTSGLLHRTGVVMAPRRGSCDGSDAAARHVVGSKVWPRWTMSSTNVRLSDFLWNYVGGRAAVDEDYNVTMEMFVQEPDDYVQDQRLLEEILNLTAYQALEAITRPLHEGVLSLGQRRDYERKGYNHSSCKEKTKRSTHAGTGGSEAGGRGKAKTNARNEIHHFH